MAMLRFLVLTVILFDEASAIVPGLSAQTTVVFQPSHTSTGPPETTKGPQLDLRRWGAMDSNDLFARQETGDTCGYVSGDASSPVVCGASSGCWTWWPSSSPWNLWCCPYTTITTSDTTTTSYFSDMCPYKSRCVTAGDGSNNNTAASATISNSILYCPSLLPNCDTIRKIRVDGQTMDLLQCLSQAGGLVTISDTSTESTPPSISTAISVSETTVLNNVTVTQDSSATSETTPSSPSSTDLSSTRDPSTVQSSSSTSSGAPSSTSTSSGDSTDTGAIAGGVVGGVAGIALIGAAIGWLMWRKKSERVRATREVSQYGGGAY